MKRSEPKQGGGPDSFDIASLRAISTDPESRRLALAAAMIKLEALAIARADPAHRKAALAIVAQVQDLHGRLPTRRSLAALVRALIPAGGTATDDRLTRAVDEIWAHFADGRRR